MTFRRVREFLEGLETGSYEEEDDKPGAVREFLEGLETASVLLHEGPKLAVREFLEGLETLLALLLSTGARRGARVPRRA